MPESIKNRLDARNSFSPTETTPAQMNEAKRMMAVSINKKKTASCISDKLANKSSESIFIIKRVLLVFKLVNKCSIINPDCYRDNKH